MSEQATSYIYTYESKRLISVMYIPCLSETNVYGIFTEKFHGNRIVQNSELLWHNITVNLKSRLWKCKLC
jgi:hypothetical protein